MEEELEKLIAECDKKIAEISGVVSQLDNKQLGFQTALNLGENGLPEEQKKQLSRNIYQCYGGKESLQLIINIWKDKRQQYQAILNVKKELKNLLQNGI